MKEPFRKFALPGLLAPERVLVLNQHDFILSQLETTGCNLIGQVLLTELESYLLTALFESWPHYAPFALLLSVSMNLPLARVERSIQEAQSLDVAVQPLRVTLSRARSKLRTFGLELVAVRGLGYTLAEI